MSETLLDDFRDVGGWTAIAPGAAQLRLTPFIDGDGPALRLDYDLGGNGFVIARRALDLTLPQDYAFVVDHCGNGPQHIVEFKLVDERLANVWRLRDEQFCLQASWSSWRIAARDIGYAWGARRARRIEHCDALEIAIVGAGAGSLCLRRLRLCDESYRGIPHVSASSTLAGHAATQVLNDDLSCWRSAAAGEQSLTLLFDQERAFSALRISWPDDKLPAAFAIDLLDASGHWQCHHNADAQPGPHSTVLLPGARTRGLRLRISAAAAHCAVRHLAFLPWYFAPDMLTGLSSLALEAPAGHYPKALREQQSYWTIIGTPDGGGSALLNTEGLLEVDGGDFAIEALVQVGTRLYTWADVTLSASLRDDYLPLPRVCWQSDTFTLAIAPVMIKNGAHKTLHISYHLTLTTAQPQPVTLYVLVRPYLVTPVWQLWQGRGGCASLTHLRGDCDGLEINHTRRVLLNNAAQAFGAQSFAAGDLVQALRDGYLPHHQAIEDHDGLAQAVFTFPMRATDALEMHIEVQVPTRDTVPDNTRLDPDSSRYEWLAVLAHCPLRLSLRQADAVHTLRAATAHILINRDGPRLQPGPRRYIRAYLRDAVGMGTALARVGLVQPLKDLLDWYGPQQRADGELPDAIDDDGPEWLPEYDAYGQYLHGVAEAQRLAPEPDFLARQWPIVKRVLARFEYLRGQRTSAAYRDTAYFGVLPESMSHEGYMAQPVHAYWDDFWALRGLHDGAWLATQVGAHQEAQRIAALAHEFGADLHRSLARTIQQHGIDFIPGSVELGDFDATAIAIALTVADDGADLPRAALHTTFDRYLAIRDARAERHDWSNYSAYEIRIVGALIRLGRRDDALRVMNGLLADCRPASWRQWPEQSWREVDAPAFLGDLPHSWIGAEYIHALTSAFAYERRADASLVLAAGVASAWLDEEGVTVTRLATHYGPLSYRLRRGAQQCVEMFIEQGIDMPPGALVLLPPLPAPLRAVTLNGEAYADFDHQQCRCHTLPAHFVFYCEEVRA